MRSSNGLDPRMNAGFMPAEDVDAMEQARTGWISFVLFCIVMFGVVGAFFVTNRQWSSVKSQHETVNAEYVQEARKIDQLKTLEAQRAEMLEKAAITTALIEKAPRSILLAEVINRMPTDVTLTEFNLEAERVRETAFSAKSDSKGKSRSLTSARGRGGKDKKDAEDDEPKRPEAPRYKFTIELKGVSEFNEPIADFQGALVECPLFADVELRDVKREKVRVDKEMFTFIIMTTLYEGADARSFEPLHAPRGSAIGGINDIAPADESEVASEPEGDL